MPNILLFFIVQKYKCGSFICYTWCLVACSGFVTGSCSWFKVFFYLWHLPAGPSIYRPVT